MSTTSPAESSTSTTGKRKRRVTQKDKQHTEVEIDEYDGSELSDSQTTPTNQGSRNKSKLTLDKELLKKDILILSTYVKEEMYHGVKFLYDPRNDLSVGEAIFQHFYRTCKNTLEGVKEYINQNEKELYIRYLWTQATDQRIQQDSLSVKRSSVYTVMQNRFFCESVRAGSVIALLLACSY